MNTRLQVEHPVTEMTTGVDLVAEQLRIASGLPLTVRQEDVAVRGSAIECRINAEAAHRGFIPSPRTVTAYREPEGEGVRVDSGVARGFARAALLRLAAGQADRTWDETREAATERMLEALDDFELEGPDTLIPFHRHLLRSRQWRAGGDRPRPAGRPQVAQVDRRRGGAGALMGAVAIEPFEVAVPQQTLDDLAERLARTRWPLDVGNDDWRYGTERGYLRGARRPLARGLRLARPRAGDERLAHFRAELDGVPIHFVHAPGAGPDPMPLILTHGWPWTFWDFHQVIGPLSDPAAHGGDPADAFDVVVPSLPGFGFSTPLTVTGIDFTRTADLWVRLMRDVLGYDRFAAAGGDWGALVSAQLGHAHAERLSAST